MKKPAASASEVLTIRVPRALNRKLALEARRQRRTRGELARALLSSALEDTHEPDPAAEARRQSRLVSRHASEQDALDFIASVADLRGWR